MCNSDRSLARTAVFLVAVVVAALVGPLDPVVGAEEQTAIHRIGGADRFETAALVSATVHSDGAGVVYVATGDDYADALAAGPAAAAGGGSVLLTKTALLPAATRSELLRLDPTRIVIVGGEAAVSGEVASSLEILAPDVGRIGGTDRFETAALISQDAFPAGAETVFLVSGVDFADALSGGGAAAAQGSPLLLTLPDAIPHATLTELIRLDPDRIVIVGGPGAVSDLVAETLRASMGATVDRISGSDRYGTAAEIAADSPINLATLYVVSGEGFADGLATVAAAGRSGVPILLTRSAGAPGILDPLIGDLEPRSITIVGGVGAVSELAEDELASMVMASGGFQPPFTSGPFLASETSATAPLAGILDLSTSVPTRVRLQIDDGIETRIVETVEMETDHHLPVLELRAGRTHALTVSVIDEQGVETSARHVLSLTTDPLPDDFPSLSLVAHDPAQSAGGYTVMDISDIDGPGGWIVIVDDSGEPVWFWDSDIRPLDVRQLDNGNLLFIVNDRITIIEVDMFGVEVDRWQAAGYSDAPLEGTPVDTDSFHHEVLQLDDDHFVGMSSEVRWFPDYPSDEDDPNAPAAPAHVVGDVIVEFTRDGQILNQISLFDVLDPYRIAYDSLTGRWWDLFYTDTVPAIDWTHANAVVVDPIDDTFIISMRHQDALIKVTRTGELVWILGPPENWGPAFAPHLLSPSGADFTWLYHPHAPMITPDGTIVVYDNAVYQASPPDPKDNSTLTRAVEYRVDETAMTVEQVWEYETDGFARVLGDADWVGDGNVLIAFGAITGLAEGQPSARLIEVTRTDPANVVWELAVEDDNPNSVGLRSVYRSDRLQSLYR